MDHDQSVDFYTEGIVKMRMHFPHGKVDCRHCPFHKFLESFNIYQCRLTEEFFEKSELDQRQAFCPIEVQDAAF